MKQLPQKLDLSRVPGKPKRRKKVTLVFDEEKRKDFLSGFHKRKVQRQKKAKEDLEKLLKDERKKIKQNARESYKKMLSHRQIPEVEELLSREEFDVAGRTVSVLELDVVDLQKRCIGPNKVTYDENEDQVEEKEESEDEEELQGMELNTNKSIKKEEDNEPVKNMNSKKTIKQAVKQAALKQVKMSKAFKIKQRHERNKNIKESRLKAKAKDGSKLKEGSKGKHSLNSKSKKQMKKRKKKGNR